MSPPTLVIVFGKATQTASLAAAAAAAIGPSTLVLTLQNGLGNIEALRSHVPRLACSPEPPRSGPNSSVLGTSGRWGRGKQCSARSRRALPIMPNGPRSLCPPPAPTRVAADVLGVIWAKVAFNCVMNTLCAIASIPVSALACYDGFDELAGDLAEVAAVASAEGVAVDTAAALRLMKAQFDPAASGDHLASTLQDLMNGLLMEIVHLNGAVAARAQSHGIEAPLNTLVTQLIGLLEATWPRRVTRLHPNTQ